jgi:hypothetical protein
LPQLLVIRLAAMPGTNRLLPLLALLFVLAALSGCGSDEISGEISQAEALELNNALNEVGTGVETQDCEGAQTAADQFVNEVNDLPLDAGEDLKTALRDAGNHLRALVSEQCPSTGTDTTTSPATTPTTTPTTPTTTTSSTTTSSTTDTTTTSSSTTDEQPSPGDGGGGGSSGDGGGTGGGTGGTGGGGTGDESGD